MPPVPNPDLNPIPFNDAQLMINDFVEFCSHNSTLQTIFLNNSFGGSLTKKDIFESLVLGITSTTYSGLRAWFCYNTLLQKVTIALEEEPQWKESDPDRRNAVNRTMKHTLNANVFGYNNPSNKPMNQYLKDDKPDYTSQDDSLTAHDMTIYTTQFANTFGSGLNPLFNGKSGFFNEEDAVLKDILQFSAQRNFDHVRYYFAWDSRPSHSQYPLRLIMFGVDADNNILWDTENTNPLHKAIILQKSWPPK